MKKHILASILSCAALTNAAFAQQPVCELAGAEAIPIFEKAKLAFLRSDFPEFVDIMRQSLGNGASALSEPLLKVKDIVPNGFDSCQVIAQRKDIGGLIQEVATFNIKGSVQPLSLYLSAMPVRGELIIGQVNFNTAIGPVLRELK